MGLRLLHLNLHGLIRSHDLELGRDSDTGGQTLYVLELVKGLAARPEVDKVQLFTRLIHDRRVSTDYAKPVEKISSCAEIIRLPFGPKRYVRKELLWPYLDDLADQIVQRLQQDKNLPDWIHAHYADAGYVGALVSRRLGLPLVFTGHSLGREKLRRLLAAGVDHDQIEQTYSISKRIDAEEIALAHSNLLITSTKQESDEQYSRYGKFSSKNVETIPPGVDLNRFHSIDLNQTEEEKELDKIFKPFLRNTKLSPLLAISRAVRRKNIPALIETYGRSPVLQQRHNLILILGCREDSRQLEKQQKEVFQQIFELVDKYNLYGKVAYPKQHKREQIPSIYRWVAKRKGLFVNPALTEPFGLTLLEAAACGLPLVATDDGGPRDILSRCENGLLVDVTDLEAFRDGLETAGSNSSLWKTWSNNGVEAVSRHFSWDAHVCNYIALMQKRLKFLAPRYWTFGKTKEATPISKNLLLLDLDNYLEQSESQGLSKLRNKLNETSFKMDIQLGILTGRSIKSARHLYAAKQLPKPAVWICQAGTEIYYSDENKTDIFWQESIAIDWNRKGVEKALFDLKDYMELQSIDNQAPYKVSYLLKEPSTALLPLVRKRLRQAGLAALPHLKCHWYLDIVPLRASRAEAIRFLTLRWGLSLEKVLIVASQQGDAELLKGLTPTVVTCDHDASLERFRTQQRVFFSDSEDCVLDGLKYFRFFNTQ
ncbi:HAD family hydrolase [Prochlorococcus marinus]|uniref:sucrose-phosphate synthase n=1 Tax=Prochlorococcus marinus XMU1408 TaxID=2213228 RepID=A0A318QW83_PROMR|nr:HAD family hydrolase [Prochlorococcus marinus]MBW3042974.1 glycosyl transferase family 1 [Prochlorococcus marinus str. XMU1408]PYE00325.1 glycosyl transferase family 1 [Prochlorococcus marinus XMU1408]